jgi:hypothetical protein
MVLCSCRTHSEKASDIYEWQHVRSILWEMKYQEAREALTKEKGYPDYGVGRWESLHFRTEPKIEIENKYEIGFKDGWTFIPSIFWSSTGIPLEKKIEEMKTFRQDEKKNEYARGFIDGINEYNRIDNEAKKNADNFISSFKSKYQESYPYYSRF